MGMFNKSKFVFSETFNNEDGKTSGSAFIGVLIGLVSTLGLLCSYVGFLASFDSTMEFMSKLISIIGISAALLGVRKIAGKFNNNDKNNVEPQEKG